MIVIKNKWSNHTGLAAMNLYLSNVWAMYKWDVRTKGSPYGGWKVGNKKLIKAAFLGWFGKHNVRSCKIEKQ